jgi:hypothetical protein
MGGLRELGSIEARLLMDRATLTTPDGTISVLVKRIGTDLYWIDSACTPQDELLIGIERYFIHSIYDYPHLSGFQIMVRRIL